MALFGVPVALEDACLRACRAALLIQHRLAAILPEMEATYGLRPQMRIGINTGPVIVGKVQSGDSTGVTALGDTVNLASRLQSIAEPGSVLLSETAHRQVQGIVESRPAGEPTIKGKAERQRVYRLDSIKEGATRFDTALSRGLTTYIGRTKELEVLERCLNEAARSLRIVDIVGEPGIGKSRLLHEFRQRVADKRVFILSGSCTPDSQQTPFLPFIDVVRASFRVSVGEAEGEVARKLEKGLTVLGLGNEQALALLLNLLGLKTSDGALTELDGVLIGLRTRDLLLSLLQERCRIMPVIMVLEDLHWIDSVSEELLSKLIASAKAPPLLILHTRRPEYQPPWAGHGNATTVPIEPLSAGETSQVVQARLRVTDLPAPLARMVAGKADGNPLFAEEIATFLVERGAVHHAASGIKYDAAAVAAALPGSIQSTLTARVDRLAPEDRALLQAAAVIGRRFAPDLLAAVSDLHEIGDGLSAMQDIDLVHHDAKSGEFVFKHVLLRDALYKSLLEQRRTTLHLKIAEEIEQRSHNRLPEVAEQLAHHYGHTPRTDKAFTYLVAAGRKSLGVYSLDDAEQYFERALDLLESTPHCAGETEVAALIADMSQLLIIKFHPGKLKQLIDRHMPLIDALGDLSSSVIMLSNYCFGAGMMCEYRVAVEAAERALDMALRLDDDRSRAYARAAVIMSKTMIGTLPLEEMEHHARLGVLESDRANDAYLQSWIRLATAWHYMQRGLTTAGRAVAIELAGFVWTGFASG